MLQHRAGIIGDPLYRYGDLLYSWVGRGNFSYTTTITIAASQLAADDILLVFDGIETNATVFLNGAAILVVSDAWLRYSVSVKHLLTVGANTLRVGFLSLYDACMFEDPGMVGMLSDRSI